MEDPGRYSVEIAVMKEMQWSWSDLYYAPPDLVEEITFKRQERQRLEKQRKQREDAKGGRT